VIVTADAEKLEATFKQVEEFWKKRGADDAVNFATKTQTAAADVAKAAKAGNLDEAAAQVKSLQSNSPDVIWRTARELPALSRSSEG
jgi:hypothetical protein